jgi:hypothetical protein
MPGGLAAGGEAALGWNLRTPTWRLGALVGAGYFPARAAALAATGEGGRFSLLTLSLRACASAVRGRFEAGPCAGGELDRMSASGFGPAAWFEAANASAWWGAGLVGVTASWSVSPLLAVVARGEAVLTPAQQRFVRQPGAVLVHSPAQLAGRVALGIELRFF